MKECICSNCQNLKSIIPDDSEEVSFECEFGYPSFGCEGCQESECDKEITCSNYIFESSEEELVSVNCKKCGRELKKALNEKEDGDIYCVQCFLENKL